MLRMVGEAGAHSRLSAIDATKRPVMSMIVLTYHGTVRSRTVISMRLGRLGNQADVVDAQIAPMILKRLRECLCAPLMGVNEGELLLRLARRDEWRAGCRTFAPDQDGRRLGLGAVV